MDFTEEEWTLNEIYEKLVRCYNSVREKIDFTPKVALILGSGLGDYADGIEVTAKLDYHDIEGFPVSTVFGHKGQFIFGYVNEVPVVCMQGRVHYYEGYSMPDVVLPIRLMKMMGAQAVILTNASGGINTEFEVGDLMMITGQISCFVPNPLIGANIEELGVRFPDMSNVYDKQLQQTLRKTAKELDIPLKEGVYVQLTGPSYESPQEIKMLRTLGADAVGMSTVCEAIAANHMGMKICGISCISNMAAGILDQPLCHEEVQAAADKAAPRFKKLVTACITAIGKENEAQ
jgi:purine-nucleoside phosphorylase